MVVLDENSVIERKTMVHAAAGAHGIFFQCSQPRRRLTGAGGRGFAAGNGGNDFCGDGGDARQVAKEIQRRALRRQKAARGAFDRRDDIAGGHGCPILHMPFHRDGRVYQLESKVRRIETGNNARFARSHDDDRAMIGGNDGGGGDIARQP
ncbi:hypothetical protein D3C72_1645350 [compost metagenome]